MLQLEVPAGREVQWRFMDGPHGVTLTKVTGDASTGVFELPLVHGSLLRAAERVAVHCDGHGMFSRDLETLRDALQRLKANQPVQRTGASRSAHIEIRPLVAAGSRR